jgi:NagD protein
VLTGISTRDTAERFPYRPSQIVDSVADLVDMVRGSAGS